MIAWIKKTLARIMLALNMRETYYRLYMKPQVRRLERAGYKPRAIFYIMRDAETRRRPNEGPAYALERIVHELLNRAA